MPVVVVVAAGGDGAAEEGKVIRPVYVYVIGELVIRLKDEKKYATDCMFMLLYV